MFVGRFAGRVETISNGRLAGRPTGKLSDQSLMISILIPSLSVFHLNRSPFSSSNMLVRNAGTVTLNEFPVPDAGCSMVSSALGFLGMGMGYSSNYLSLSPISRG